MNLLIMHKELGIGWSKQPQLSYKPNEMKTYQHLNMENLTETFIFMQVCTRIITISLAALELKFPKNKWKYPSSPREPHL